MRIPLAVTSRCWRSFTETYRILLQLLLTVILFLGSAAAIYFACEYFVNGVEWLGRKLGVGETATGTILAAFGTALPESAVTFVAVVFGKDAAQKDIGVGAALGGPMVLSTICYAVVGLAMLWNRRRLGRATSLIECDSKRLRRDQSWFLSIFIVKVALGLLVFAYKPWLGALFLLAYVVYLLRELRGAQVLGAEELEPLKLRPRGSGPVLATGANHARPRCHRDRLQGVRRPTGIHRNLGRVVAATGGVAAESGGHRVAGNHERADLGPSRQGAACAGQYFRRDDDPGHHPNRAWPVLHVLGVLARAARLGSRHHGGGCGIAGAVLEEFGQRAMARAARRVYAVFVAVITLM